MPKGRLFNTKGQVTAGRGAELTDLQKEFLSEVKQRGFQEVKAIVKELNYTSYHRDKRNMATAFYRELHKLAASETYGLEAAKGMNINKLILIRDTAIEEGDYKTAMKAIEVINSMLGHNAPQKVTQTKIDVKATIDLTKPVVEDERIEDVSFDDIEDAEFEED